MPPLSRTINYQQLTINKRKGFTLIELLVVIALIGILASFAIASFTSAQAKGRDSKRKADLNAVRTALELNRQDCISGSWYIQGGPASDASRYATLTSYLSNANLNYIKSRPVDPLNNPPTYYYGYITYTSGSGFLDASSTVPGCPDFTGGMTIDGSSDYRLTARFESTSDPQIALSQTKCPAIAGVTYTSNTYVVCND